MARPAQEATRAPARLDWTGLGEELQSQAASECSPEDLARHYGISQEFIEDVLAGIAAPPERANPLRSLKRLFFGAIREAVRQLRDAFEKWTVNPWIFFLATTLLLSAPIYASLWTSGAFRPITGQVRVSMENPAAAALFLVLALQCSAMFKYARYQRAWIGSVLFYLSLQPAAILIAIQLSRRTTDLPSFSWLVVSMLALLPAVAHAGLLSLSALGGKWWALRSAERTERRLTRQQMLERVFALEQQLAAFASTGRAWTRRRGFRDWARTSQAFPPLGAVFGLGYGLLEVGFIGFVSRILGANQGPADFIGILQNLGGVLFLALVGLYAFFAGGVWRGVTAAVTAAGMRLVTGLVPFGLFGLPYFQAELQSGRAYLPLGMALAAGLLGGAGGRVDDKAQRGRQVRANEPAALLAEWVRLQQRLKAAAQSKVIMAVDVARSTRLKAMADPLAVEFSFREYQALVARVSERFGGEVFSTAGDGALASFSSAEDALRAAKTVQTEINDFNDTINRLDDPFRLRIGLHAGETLADFSEAPFNELIDIAAHVESVAPVGGIAATWAFRQSVPHEPTADINTVVDGHNVAIILNPMVAQES